MKMSAPISSDRCPNRSGRSVARRCSQQLFLVLTEPARTNPKNMLNIPLVDGRAPEPWLRLVRRLIVNSDNWWRHLAGDDLIAFTGEVFHDQWQSTELEERIKWLVEQMRECVDILPPDCCERFGVPEGSTYGYAVRILGVLGPPPKPPIPSAPFVPSPEWSNS